jgi:large subunit ribosomal protein L23
MAQLEQIILKPLMTEKASFQTENFNRYGFLVVKDTNKNQIKEAIEKLYDVRVVKVWTSVIPGKLKRFGRFSNKTKASKKAYVQIEEGQKIEFFKGI